MDKKNQNKELVSVIMPAYNHVKYVSMAIESVLKQTYSELELIIIDNYSIDGTSEVVEQYSYLDKRVRHIKYNNEGIIANSRNRGLDVAKGVFIAFIDSDDIWIHTKLEKQLLLFSQQEVGFVYSRSSVIDSEGKMLMKRSFQRCLRGYIQEYLLLTTVNIVNSTVIVRKILFDKEGIRFRNDCQGAEDWDLWIRLTGSVKTDYVDKPLVLYRVHKRATSKNRDMMLKSALTVIDNFKKMVMDSNKNHNIKNNKLCCLAKYAIQHSYVLKTSKRGSFCKAIGMSLYVIILCPFRLIGWLLVMRTFLYYGYHLKVGLLPKRS